MQKAKEYFDKKYGVDHIKTVIEMNDMNSLYGLMEEYAEKYSLHNVSKCYTEKDMDDAYDKGFKDGNQQDLTGSLIAVL